MPVGAPPTPETLERLRPQLAAMLDRPLRLCVDGGGRVLGKGCPDGTVKPVDKLGGYSIRPLAYWAETGRYPDRPIPKCPHDPYCVDCGRFVLDGEPAPGVDVIEPELPIPPPPPVPPSGLESVVSVERGGSGVEDAPLGASSALVPAPVPAGVPRPHARSLRPPGWAVPVLVLLLFGIVMTVAVSGVRTLVSPLEDEVPAGDVVVVSVATIPGQ